MSVRISKRRIWCVSGAILLIAIIILAWPAISFAEDRAASGVQSAKEQAAQKARNAGILGVLNKIQDPQVVAIFSRDGATTTELNRLVAVSFADANGAGRLGQMSNAHPDRQAVRLVSDSPSAKKKQQAAEMARNASILGVLKKAQNPDLAAIFSRDYAVGGNEATGGLVLVSH